MYKNFTRNESEKLLLFFKKEWELRDVRMYMETLCKSTRQTHTDTHIHTHACTQTHTFKHMYTCICIRIHIYSYCMVRASKGRTDLHVLVCWCSLAAHAHRWFGRRDDCCNAGVRAEIVDTLTHQRAHTNRHTFRRTGKQITCRQELTHRHTLSLPTTHI